MADNYSTFADLYDSLFDLDLYQAWAAFVRERSTACPMIDLAGGSGRLGVLLSQAGYQVTLIDLSEQMLGLAAKHAAENDVHLDLIQTDMTADWGIPDQFPLITSFADSLNYLVNKQQFAKALTQVYRHLRSGGRFLFDVITPYQVNVHYDNFMYNNDDDPEKIFMWSSFPGDEKNSVDHDLKFFIYDERLDAFKLVREVHHEQAFPLTDYTQMLKQTGFVNIQISADFGRQPVGPGTARAFFSAEKA
ncbi:MAG: class I SAM-dependent methyltransferase [Oenococcus sp.]|uniref:class I SAM-dependent DNA methyltransferase n=1 Tax=Oenococcus sp. TaxID=1979414 RepID=UPI0039EC6E0E